MVSKENQIKFYTEELKEIEFTIKKIFNSTGLSLFQNGEVYVAQYRGYDEKRGNVFIDIPTGKGYHSPRLDQNLTCFTLQPGLERPSAWADIKYSDLIKGRNLSEAKIVDFIPSNRDGWITMLVRGLDVEFMVSLQYNQLLGFGPTLPPYEYLINLKKLSENFNEDGLTLWEKLLSFKFNLNNQTNPKLLKEETDIAGQVIKEVDNSKIYVLEGPPGTGKTFQIADIVSRLVLSNNSVLVTALTNKATLEVCEKPFFEILFRESRVSKLPISIDERKKFPNLVYAKDLTPIKGHLTLTTYYQFSKIWEKQTQAYDYIVVEEGSQAFLTTIAAAIKVGKRVIVVGDPKQIVPIVQNNNYKVIQNIDFLINGMSTLSQINNFLYSRKIETRRLTVRSTLFTNYFYNGTILSKSLYEDLNSDLLHLNKIKAITHPLGGPVLIEFSKGDGSTLTNMTKFLVLAINELKTIKGNDIAVLTPYIESLTYLQQNLKTKTLSKNYLIESVDRVQGLDVDYCFYVIPRSSSFSFNLNRFNVATSRAKKCTFILVEKDFNQLLNLPVEVNRYVSNLIEEFSFTFDPINEAIVRLNPKDIELVGTNTNHENATQNFDTNRLIDKDKNIGLKVIGKIDVSKFEKPKKEIVKGKENIYIIDTNVFVNHPEIISKIDQKYSIVLSAKVIDELDYLKISLTEDQKRNVQKALKQINESIDKRGIKMEMADLSLLPNDFNKKSPDNFILSVALKFKTENPIMLTSDNGLQIKAKGLGITTISLKDFLNQKKYY